VWPEDRGILGQWCRAANHSALVPVDLVFSSQNSKPTKLLAIAILLTATAGILKSSRKFLPSGLLTKEPKLKRGIMEGKCPSYSTPHLTTCILKFSIWKLERQARWDEHIRQAATPEQIKVEEQNREAHEQRRVVGFN
jgi:hypothetical protein